MEEIKYYRVGTDSVKICVGGWSYVVIDQDYRDALENEGVILDLP